MHKSIIVLLSFLLLISCSKEQANPKATIQTICNPIDLSYRFCLDEPSRREAADPTMVLSQGKYFLFASKSGGYWHSDDLVDWSFVTPTGLNVEEYAPTAIDINGTMYYLASSTSKSTIYKSDDPVNGQWSVAVDSLQIPVWDPAFYMDDDDRLYLYWGCSNIRPLYGVEVDYKNDFAFIGEPVVLKHANTAEHGWEVPGDYNTRTATAPWIEGAWMNKHNGTYYFQYSGPGTEFKSYADAVYTSDSPLGPFTVADHNPFVYRPEGFAAAAGHGSTFLDKYGNYWHIGTATISMKHMFERRLVLHPTFFDADGIMHSPTRFGDYPFVVPTKKINSERDLFTRWMLLSYGKNVEVSSSVDTLPPNLMNDEDIRTYWAAQSGSKDEYALMDLGEEYDVRAIQINFAEHNTNIHGRTNDIYHQYIIEQSNDKTNWTTLIDKSQNKTDNTHNYTQLPESQRCRYLRIKNIAVPDGHFAISGFRVFGSGNGNAPQIPTSLIAQRNPDDRRSVTLTWDAVNGANGYNIIYGVQSDKMYHTYTVHSDTDVTINTLSTLHDYHFTIESFNENGVSPKGPIRVVE